MQDIDTSVEQVWSRGFSWDTYLRDEVEAHPELWSGMYRISKAPEWAVERFRAIGGHWRLLIIAEDWCGDASNTVPILARLAEAADNLELRIVKRDEHPDLMDEYLTDGARSIPVVIILDEEFRPVAHWGPRPAELQEFVIAEKTAGEREADDIYKDARRWYAKDKGETTIRDLLDLMEAAAPV